MSLRPSGPVLHSPCVVSFCRNLRVFAGLSEDGRWKGCRGRTADLQKHWQQTGGELPTHQIVSLSLSHGPHGLFRRAHLGFRSRGVMLLELFHHFKRFNHTYIYWRPFLILWFLRCSATWNWKTIFYCAVQSSIKWMLPFTSACFTSFCPLESCYQYCSRKQRRVLLARPNMPSTVSMPCSPTEIHTLHRYLR